MKSQNCVELSKEDSVKLIRSAREKAARDVEQGMLDAEAYREHVEARSE